MTLMTLVTIPVEKADSGFGMTTVEMLTRFGGLMIELGLIYYRSITIVAFCM